MVDYELYNRKDWQVKMTAVLQNIFNDYQQDFDFGADREASYIPGPLKTRSLVLGHDFKMKQ
jgi:outer membrane receptor for ferrienterochelin and colicins